MKADTMKAGAGRTARSRYTELKQMLDERRREIQAEVQGKMRDVRAEGTWGGKQNEVLDAVESSEADIQDEIEFALIQMKSETLNKINDALARLEQGDYGNCFECGEEIAEKRLRALPFAVRCKDCEEAREVAEQRERQLRRAARRVLALLRHVRSGVPRRAPPVAEPDPSPPATPDTDSRCPARPGHSEKEVAMSDQHRGPQVRGRLDRRAAARRFRRSCRFCRCATRCSFRIRSCRSPWRARAPSA